MVVVVVRVVVAICLVVDVFLRSMLIVVLLFRVAVDGVVGVVVGAVDAVPLPSLSLMLVVFMWMVVCNWW